MATANEVASPKPSTSHLRKAGLFLANTLRRLLVDLLTVSGVSGRTEGIFATTQCGPKFKIALSRRRCTNCDTPAADNSHAFRRFHPIASLAEGEYVKLRSQLRFPARRQMKNGHSVKLLIGKSRDTVARRSSAERCETVDLSGRAGIDVLDRERNHVLFNILLIYS
jgi:hypothetical protein